MKDFKVYQTSGMLNFLVSEASDVRRKEQTLSGDIVSFTADEQSPLKIVVDIDSTGCTWCNIYQTGAAIWGGTEISDVFVANGGAINTQAERTSISSANIDNVVLFNAPFKENTRYTLILDCYKSNGTTDRNSNIYFYYTDGTRSSILLTQPVGTEQVVVATSEENKTLDKIQGVNVAGTIVVYYNKSGLFEGVLTESDFDPYVGTTFPISWQTEAGTITDGTLTIDYDGSVTLETGGQTYTLTSISPIETFIGDNNIWSDAGPVSVTYPI